LVTPVVKALFLQVIGELLFLGWLTIFILKGLVWAFSAIVAFIHNLISIIFSNPTLNGTRA
jgi:hypothetical protein